MSATVRILRGPAEVAHAAADHLAEVVSSGRPLRIALAGGRTPEATYSLLARRNLDWSRVEVLFGDERCVPPDHPASNHAMARRTLLDHIAPAAVHRIRGELDPHQAAKLAEADLRRLSGSGDRPALDLAILGMGADGHTASLFPDGPEVDERDRWALPVYRPDLPQPWRVSLTLPVLNAAHRLVVVVDGAEKADAVRRALDGDPAIPAGRLRRDPTVLWLLTRPAASAIASGPPPN